MAEDLRKLKETAMAAAEKGKHKAAFEAYVKLAAAEPREPGWPHRAGELARRLGRREDALKWLGAAADAYANQGFLLKAIAVCKVLLEIDPQHTRTQTTLAELYAKQGTPAGKQVAAPPAVPAVGVTMAPPEPKPVAAGPEPPAAPRSSAAVQAAPPQGLRLAAMPPIELEAGRPLEAVRLRSLVEPAAATAPRPGSTQLVIELDLDAPVAAAPARGGAALPQIPLFSSLPQDALRLLIERLEVRRADRGEDIVRRGETGDALFVLARGGAVALVPGPDGVEVEVGRLAEGAFFGEVALLADVPRSATVRATDESEVLVIGRDVVSALVTQSPAVLPELLRFLRDRLLANLLATSPLFTPFSDDERRDLAARFRFLEMEEGAVLIQEGTPAPGLQILLCGTAEVLGGTQVLATLGAGDVCGEMSLLAREGASATVMAASKCWVLELPRSGFQELIVTHPQILIYVNELAEARRRANQWVEGGQAPGEAEGELVHLVLV